jgi:hypothetical protein
VVVATTARESAAGVVAAGAHPLRARTVPATATKAVVTHTALLLQRMLCQAREARLGRSAAREMVLGLLSCEAKVMLRTYAY